MALRVGIDTGGTFTDLIGVVQNEQSEVSGRLIVTKRPSTPRHPEAGVFETLAGSGISPSDIGSLILGSTMAINMLHTRSGARVLYLTTQGFEDVLFIQRINRRFHYDLDWVKPAPFAERRDCLGVRERITKDGDVLIPLDEQELARLRAVVTERLAEGAADDRPAAIAINLLFSYVNPRHEQELAAFLQRELPDVPVSLSHAVAPIWREYERGSTTVADAYIKPHVAAFAGNLDRGFRERGLEAPWALMKSNGGTMLPAAAPQQAVQLLLSGLAGGIIAGRYFGDLVGMAGQSRTDGASKVITFDMGGTSTDVGLVIDGEYGYTTEYQVEWGIPVAAPFIDITTIGAGGGSLAWVDKGGFLKVGPQSAGADPGPACYDAGGADATVTDANLVLGRLNPDYFLAGTMALNRDRASKAVANMGRQVGLGLVAGQSRTDGARCGAALARQDDAALAIVQLANENMANALRLLTVERGIDPREFDLVAFGGAGPLHAVALAEAVGIRRVIVPPHAGLTSALGTLLADLRVDRSWTHAYRSNDLDVARINERFDELTESALQDLRAEGFAGAPTIARSISMRYLGQNYEQDVPVPPGPIGDESIAAVMQRFHQQHEAFYGYSIAGEIMELIHFNVSVIGATPNVTLPRWPTRSDGGGTPTPRSHREVHFAESGRVRCPIYRRTDLPAGAALTGPAIIEDADSTTLLPTRRQLTVTEHGLLLIEL